MSETKFTPGPWRVVGKASGYIMAPDGPSVVQVGTVGAYRDKELLPFNKERWDADGHLIAAAPVPLSPHRRVNLCKNCTSCQLHPRRPA